MAGDNKPDTPAPNATPSPAPKASEKESFNNAPDNPFDNFIFEREDNAHRQEKQDGMQELMEILKGITTDFNNAAMDFGGKIYNYFNAQDNTAEQDTTKQQDNPIQLGMAADTQDTKLATLGGMDDTVNNPLSKMTPTPEPNKKLDDMDPTKLGL